MNDILFRITFDGEWSVFGNSYHINSDNYKSYDNSYLCQNDRKLSIADEIFYND